MPPRRCARGRSRSSGRASARRRCNQKGRRVSRKTEIINVTSEGRDKGKQFIITEMPALRAERWAFRALLALAHSGVQLPEGAADGGMAVLASAGLQAL